MHVNPNLNRVGQENHVRKEGQLIKTKIYMKQKENQGSRISITSEAVKKSYTSKYKI